MSGLSGLELRKAACEALGWAIVQQLDYATLQGPDYLVKSKIFGPALDRLNIEYLVNIMPAIESDPGVSEPMFLEWCEKNDYGFDLFTDGGGFLMLIFTRQYPAKRIGEPVSAETPSEARARAIVAARDK